jgi:hypothetical protein
MRTINYLICKLYDNFAFGNIRPSLSNFYFSKISVSLIIFLWLYVLVYFLRRVFNIELETSFTWFYIIVFFIIFYFLNKYSWSLSQAEAFVNNEKNKEVLNRMMLIFWATLIIPTVVYVIIFKR